MTLSLFDFDFCCDCGVFEGVFCIFEKLSLRFLSVLDGSRCFLSVISETPETWRNAPVAVRNLRKKLKDITGQKYVHVLKVLGQVLPGFCTIYMM
jgi:hypothetical protein